MSSVAIRLDASVWRVEWERALAALRGIRGRHVGLALIGGLVLATINLPMMLENVQKYGLVWTQIAVMSVVPLIAAQCLMVGWVIADAADRNRVQRLAVTLVVASVIASALALGIWVSSGAGAAFEQVWAQRGKPPLPLPLMFLTDVLMMLLLGGLVFTVLELLHRRTQTQREFHDVVRRQATIAQQVLESRMAAMQAQVEPRFLFDSLVDIEALYARDPLTAADLLDRLIVYLRAALPKLREQGTTLAAEFELVQAYVSVLSALHDGRPRLSLTIGDDCANVRFYPMLLLPLIQRAARANRNQPPESIRIGASRIGDEVAIVLRIAAAGGCSDDAELARVRERLAGLAGHSATLDCVEISQNTTQLTVRFPVATAARAPVATATATAA